MKFVKISALLIAAMLFAFACSKSEPPKSNNANAPAQNANKPANTPSNAAPSNATSNANSTTPGGTDVAAINKLYTDKCAKCHKEDGKGGVTEIDGEKVKAPDFASASSKKASDQDFTDIINDGEPDENMPAFKGKISDAEIAALVKKIRTEFQK